MCDPMTLTGLALAAGSTVANTLAANKAANAREDVLAAERIRQNQLDREAAALNDTSRDRYAGTQEKQAAKARDLEAFFTGPNTAGEANDAAATVSPSDTSDVTVREMAKQTGNADAFTGQQAQRLATMRSFGDLLGDNARLQAQDASMVGQIGGFKRGSSNVTPLELDAASQKGQGLRLLGDLLGGAGSLATGYGLTRGAPGGGTVPILGGRTAAAGAAPATSLIPRPRPNSATLYPTGQYYG